MLKIGYILLSILGAFILPFDAPMSGKNFFDLQYQIQVIKDNSPIPAVSFGVWILLLALIVYKIGKKIFNGAFIGMREKAENDKFRQMYMQNNTAATNDIDTSYDYSVNKNAKEEFHRDSVNPDVLEENISDLHGIYLSENGKYTQIDDIVIGNKAVWVIEAKDYNGKVTATDDKHWEVITRGNKSTFKYSPIKQNETHINVLKQYLNDMNVEFRSMIVYGAYTELRDMRENTKNVPIVIDDTKEKMSKYETLKDKVLGTIREEERNIQASPLTDTEVDKLEAFFREKMNVTEEEKKDQIKFASDRSEELR